VRLFAEDALHVSGEMFVKAEGLDRQAVAAADGGGERFGVARSRLLKRS